MRVDLVSIFPEALRSPLAIGLLGKAQERGLLEVACHDLRDFADPPHRRVDDEPYGGGCGMLFKAVPWFRAVAAVRRPGARAAVILTTPSGEVLDQALVRELGQYEQLVVLCDRYEGSDERIRTRVTHEVSLGDFVLMGGESAALVIVEAVARLVPGLVGEAGSLERDSFSAGLLEHGQYTRPAEFRGMAVPPVILGGHHAQVEQWRRRQALRRTLERRPDLLDGLPLPPEERAWLRRARGGDSLAPEAATTG